MEEKNIREDEYAETEKELEILKEKYQEIEMSDQRLEELKKVMKKGKEDNRRERRRQRRVRTMQSAAAVLVLLILLPNTSASAAHAMEQIPLLGNLVKAVTLRNYEYVSERHQAEVDVAKLAIEETPEDATEAEEQSESSSQVPPQGRAAVSIESRKEAEKQLGDSIEEINAEIESITENLITEFEAYMEDETGYQDLMVTSEVVATTKDYFTLKIICYQGAGSGYQWNYFYTVDLNTGKRLKLEDLFTEGADYITPISENIKVQMKEQMEKDENVRYWLEDEIDEWNFKSITEETSFYVNQAGNVVICFNEGDVAPMYMGIVEFEIPSQVIADLKK